MMHSLPLRRIARVYMKLAALMLIVCLSADAQAQNANTFREYNSFRNVLPQMMDSASVPGLSIAVIKDSMIWQQGFGFKNVETQSTVRGNTVFEAASLSKPVFAYIVLKLVEKGKLDLDRPLMHYVPKDILELRFFKGEVTDKRTTMITARMVLTHSTGFPNWRPKGGKLAIDFLPGSQFSYSGEGYILLQRVVEHLTGRPLNRLARTYVFDPFGMENSSFVWQDEYGNLMANGHNPLEEAKAFRKQKKAGSAYSMLTTAADYSKFMMGLMYGGGLKKEFLEEMCKSQISTGYGEEDGFAWGLGVGLQETSKGKAFWHWGDNGIFKCYMVGIPEAKRAMVYFTNSSNGLSLGKKIVKFTLGIEPPNFQHLGYDQYDSPTQLVKMAISRESVSAALRVYSEVKSTHRGLGSPFNEESITRLGYNLLEQEKIEAAIEVFKINVREFPDSWNVYDSLGEAYLVKGEEKLAIKNYKQSLQLNPNNENGKKMLARILK